jgi:hypothetical protein
MIQQVINLKFNIFAYLVQKTWSDDFACMNGYHGATTVGVLNKMMTPFDSDYSKSCIVESSD